MTKQLIYSTKSTATTDLKLINDSVKGKLTKGTTDYTYIVKHPTLTKWAIRIDVSGNYFKTVAKVIDAAKLQEVTSDWNAKLSF